MTPANFPITIPDGTSHEYYLWFLLNFPSIRHQIFVYVANVLQQSSNVVNVEYTDLGEYARWGFDVERTEFGQLLFVTQDGAMIATLGLELLENDPNSPYVTVSMALYENSMCLA